MMSETLLTSAVFIAGVTSFFSPCTFPLMPAYIGVLTDQSYDSNESYSQKVKIVRWFATVIRSLAFVLGISTTFITLGFGAGSFGRFFAQSGDELAFIGGIIVVIMGLHQMELLKLSILERTWNIRFKTKKIKNTATKEDSATATIKKTAEWRKWIKAYLLGITLSFGWSPCVGAVLGAVLVTTATQGTEMFGATMMAFYALGLSLPFVLLALASGVLLQFLPAFEKHLGWIKRVGGAIVVLMGLLLMTGQLTKITIWLNRFSM